MFTKQELNLILLNRKQNKLHELIEYLNGPIHKRALDGFNSFEGMLPVDELIKLLPQYNDNKMPNSVLNIEEIINDFKLVTGCKLKIEWTFRQNHYLLHISWE